MQGGQEISYHATPLQGQYSTTAENIVSRLDLNWKRTEWDLKKVGLWLIQSPTIYRREVNQPF